MRVALGMKARTGRAVLVAVGGNAREPRFVERTQIPLLPEGAFAPYHAAEGLPKDQAHESVKRSIAAAHRLAASGIRKAAKRCTDSGHQLVACAVLVGAGMPNWSVDEILAVHVHMHQAEGELFRDVLVAGAKTCGLEPVTLRDKAAFDDATAMLGLGGLGLMPS